jgi:hypothetical protein
MAFGAGFRSTAERNPEKKEAMAVKPWSFTADSLQKERYFPCERVLRTDN